MASKKGKDRRGPSKVPVVREDDATSGEIEIESADSVNGFNSLSCIRNDGKAGLMVQLQVKPGARTTQITGVNDGRLHLSVDAPPIDGAANSAVESFVASLLSIRRSRLRLERGQTSRMKSLRIHPPSSVDDENNEQLIQRLKQAIEVSTIKR